jgi:hypothetical protein
MTVVRPGRIERGVTLDQLSGEVTHRLYIDGGVFGPSGKFRLEEIGVELAHVFERIYRIKPGEPNSALCRDDPDLRDGARRLAREDRGGRDHELDGLDVRAARLDRGVRGGSIAVAQGLERERSAGARVAGRWRPAGADCLT